MYRKCKIDNFRAKNIYSQKFPGTGQDVQVMILYCTHLLPGFVTALLNSYYVCVILSLSCFPFFAFSLMTQTQLGGSS